MACRFSARAVVVPSLCALLTLALCSPLLAESQQPKTSSTQPKVDPFRLPGTVIPESYEIDVTPDLNKASFTGDVRIKIQIKQATSQIILNAVSLTVTNVTARPADGAVTKGTAALEQKTERVILTFPATLQPGSCTISMHYAGSLNDKLRGFYRSSYKDSKGKQAYMAVTQMEATDARRMFPCFDEPSLKSTFKLTARIAPNLVAIANAPIEKESIDEKSHKKVVQFEPTPAMSSYLLALIVGDFKATPPVVADGIPIRVWAAGRDAALGTYSRDTAAKVIPYQNSYFKIKYPWKKLDLIAIPDFDAGAMENPGAVTFRESLLLLDEKASSLRSRQAMASVVAHELAHMWFGDLVTMKWWDDLWLNEAFATWMAIKTVANIVPEWDYLTTFGEERLAAMRTDATRATRAIHASVRDPQEAQQMFDEITYEKGASVLRMLEVYAGEEEFKEGIHQYLKKFSYNNAAMADLWNSLQESSGKPVSTMMNAWANQGGYPLIFVDQANGKITLRQERFWLRPEKASSNALWQVPVGIRHLSNSPGSDAAKADTVALLKTRSEEINDTKSDAPFTANAGGYGYYRVNYAPATLKKLLPRITDMNALERLALIGDQYALCISGNTSLESYMSVLEECRTETDPDVWDAVLSQLNYLNLFVEKPSRKPFEKFVQSLLKPAQSKLGWSTKSGELDKTKMLRGRLVETLGTMGGDTATIAESRKLFASYVNAPDSVAPDMVDAITGVVAYNGRSSDFDQITKLWKQAKTPEIEKRNLFALATFREAALRARVLQMAMQPAVRQQDGAGLLCRVLSSTEGRYEAWNFVQQNWPAISKRFTDHMQAGLAGNADRFVDEQHCKSVGEFFKTHKIEAGDSSVKRMLERLQVNRQFSNNASAKLAKWLSARKDV